MHMAKRRTTVVFISFEVAGHLRGRIDSTAPMHPNDDPTCHTRMVRGWSETTCELVLCIIKPLVGLAM